MPDIEVTDEMIEAGRAAWAEGLSEAEFYAAIYRAMRAKERESASPPIDYAEQISGISAVMRGVPQHDIPIPDA